VLDKFNLFLSKTWWWHGAEEGKKCGLWWLDDDSFGHFVVHGRKVIVSFLWAKLCPFKILSATFCKSCIVGVMLFIVKETSVFWICR